MKRMLTLMVALLLFLLPVAASAEHAVAYMSSRFTCGCTRGGTGTMIGRYGLITAAQNLYCHSHGKPLKTCDFYFGARSANSCWYKYDGKFRYTVYETFQNGYHSSNDIGYVIFQTPVGDETGWFGYMIGDDDDLNGEIAHEMYYDNTRHLQERYRLLDVNSSSQVYWEGCSRYTGGGPIFFEDENSNYGPYVVAVYTSSDDDGNGYGRRLTNNVIRDMRMDGAFD